MKTVIWINFKKYIYIVLQYILKTSAYPKEHEQLKELREASVDKYKDL